MSKSVLGLLEGKKSKSKTSGKGKKTSVVIEDKDESIDPAATVEAVDIYADLRYDVKKLWTLCEPQETRHWPMHDVLVKKKWPGQPERPGKDQWQASHTSRLPLLQDEELQVYSHETSMLEKRCNALKPALPEPRSKAAAKEKSETKETNSLERWDTEQRTRCVQGRTIARTVDAHPKDLVFCRPLILPPLQDHKAHSYGPESDFPQRTYDGRFWPGTAFFLLPERVGPQDDDIIINQRWTDRLLYKPPFSVVKPDLGEEPDYPPYGRADSMNTHAQEEREELRKLYVRGKGVTLVAPEPPAGHTAQEFQQWQGFSLQLEKCDSTMSCICRSLSHYESFPCGPRLESPYFVRNIVPALKLNRFTFLWGQICFHGIIEIGVVCNTGERGKTQILLENPGCCVMRYSWRKAPKVDHFNTGRYRTSPFIFDTSDGIILPEQKVSIPVQFVSETAGCWTERWFVRTTPCIGFCKKGEIPVNLWGQALEADINLNQRKQLDRELEMSAVYRMADRDTWDLVKFLPIRSRQTLMREMITPIPESRGADDVAAFLRNNTGLYYRSAPMLLLMRARRQIQPPPQSKPGQLEEMSVSGAEGSWVSRGGSFGVTFFDHSNEALTQKPTESTTLKEVTPRASSASGSHHARSRSTSPEGGKHSCQKFKTKHSESSGVLDAEKPQTPSFPRTVEAYKQPRAEIFAKAIYHQACAMTESSRPNTPTTNTSTSSATKESVIKDVNQAIMVMSLKPFAPPMLQYKYIMLRAALVQLCDNIGMAEWRLRRDLGLEGDVRFQELTSFPLGTTPGFKASVSTVPTPKTNKTAQHQSPGAGNVGKRIKSVVPSNARSPGPGPVLTSTPLSSPRGGSVELLPTEYLEPEPSPPPPIDWQSSAPRQWRAKLSQLIYMHLSHSLVSLLPVITHDGYRMDPLLPKPEI